MKKQIPIVIATIRPWNIAEYKRWKVPRGYKKVLITKKEDLTAEKLKRLNPRYVFIPHWSWIIPRDVYEQFECVVFHMTDLPFGRGGSPLQNLISRGVYKTKVTALRVAKGVDTGPIYLKRPLDISKGSAEQLYTKLAEVSFSMMTHIVVRQPAPHPQKGRATVFPRRTLEMSRLPEKATARQLYDHIRMLDAPEYPRAFIEIGVMRIEFSNACLKRGRVTADADIV